MRQPEGGTVVSYCAQRGFGFIRPDARGQDVFVHISRMRRSGIAKMRPGDRVEFERIRDNCGWQAIRPRLLETDERRG